jgi:hypothetical protein
VLDRHPLEQVENFIWVRGGSEQVPQLGRGVDWRRLRDAGDLCSGTYRIAEVYLLEQPLHEVPVRL